MFFERFARGDLEDRARCAAGEHLAFEPLDISNLIGGEKTEPIMKVHRLYHRNDPIMTASPEYRPTARAEHCYELLRAAYIRDQVEKAGVPDVKGVASYFPRFLTVISIKQRYPRSCAPGCTCRQSMPRAPPISAATSSLWTTTSMSMISTIFSEPCAAARTRSMRPRSSAGAGAARWTRSFRKTGRVSARA